jgi:hypothetical protein
MDLEAISTTMTVDDKELSSLSSLCKDLLEQQEMIANQKRLKKKNVNCPKIVFLTK